MREGYAGYVSGGKIPPDPDFDRGRTCLRYRGLWTESWRAAAISSNRQFHFFPSPEVWRVSQCG